MMENHSERPVILIADDSFVSRALLKKILSGRYDVREALNGYEALNFLKANPGTALLLLDIDMPGLDGFGVLSAANSDPALKDIPVIINTAVMDPDTQLRAFEAGATDVLTKPFSQQLVLHRVQNILARRDSLIMNARNAVLEEQLRQSELDEKTGLYNKYAFCKRTGLLLQQNPETEFVLLRGDIDRFKVYNDMFGVAAGDELLLRIGGALSKLDVPLMVCGHWEADHFVLCMPRSRFTQEAALEKFAELAVLHGDFEFVIRMGAYAVDDTGLDVALMCDRALLALKSIKNNYTERIAWYDRSMMAALLEEQEIIGEMDKALSGGQFTVYLQPQYDYAKGALRGAEALVRWKHPQKGLLTPGQFIHTFEQSGFVSKLDFYVWERACMLLRNWLDRGLDVVPLSVNISRRDIYNTALCGVIASLTEKYALPPSLLHLEITESAYMENAGQLIKTVAALREAGFTVEMDDFGSGYSSLNTLKAVPVDVLKLDMKFLEDSAGDTKGGSILTSVIRMARWLRLPVVAEGVETREQAEYLKSVGCHFMQGYLFARPMPAEEFEALLSGDKAPLEHSAGTPAGLGKASEFLSASTQATLLFNSFVGGAAIVEYRDGQLEALRVNDKYIEVLGTTHKDYADMKLNILEHLDKMGAALLVKTIEKAIATGEESSCEVCMQPGGDQYVWLSAYMRLLARDEERCILYLSIENITERVRLGGKLSAIIDSVPGGILDFEVSGAIRTRYCSDAVPQMFGYGKDAYASAFSETPLAAVHPDDLPELNKQIDGILSGRERMMETAYRHLCANGSYIHVRLTAHVTRRVGGVTYATAILINIEHEALAEQKAVRQAAELAHERASLRALYDSIPCGIMQFAPASSAADMTRLLSFNDTAWKLFGYDSREQYLEAVRGKSKLKDTHPEDEPELSRCLCALQRAPAGTRTECEHRIIHPGGGVHWLHAILNKVCYEGGEEAVQAVFSDVTQLRHAGLEHVSAALFSLYDEVFEFDTEKDSCYMRHAVSPDDPRLGGCGTFSGMLNVWCDGYTMPGYRARMRKFFGALGKAPLSGPATMNFKYMDKDGGTRWGEVTVVQLRGSTYLSCNRDITAHKKADELAAQNGVLRALVHERDKEAQRSSILIESTGLVFFDYDPASDSMAIKRGGKTGVIRETVQGYIANLLQDAAISTGDRKRLQETLLEMLKAPVRKNFEYRTRRFSEEFVPASARLASIAGQNGKISRIIGVINKLDDHEYKALRQKLFDVTGADHSGLRFDVFTIGNMLKLLDSEPLLHDSIQKALSYIGQRLDVSRAYIIEEAGDGAHCSNTFEWCAEGVEPEIDELQNFPYPESMHGKYSDMFDERGLLVCPDLAALPAWQRALLETQGIRAMVQCAMTDSGVFKGYMGVDECKGTRSWPGWELDTLRVASDVIYSYLFERRGKSSQLPAGLTLSDMDATPALVYVVDPDTREILCSNAAVNAGAGRDVTGELCYQALLGKKFPCDACPIRAYYASGASLPVVLNRNGSRAVMQASPLLWHGRRAMLVTGADEATYAADPEAVREELLESELERYTRALMPLFDELFALDPAEGSFRVLSMKDEFRASVGSITIAQAMERWMTHIVEADRPRYAEFMSLDSLREVLAKGDSASIDYSFIMPDGAVKRCRSTLIKLNGGRCICGNKDITELENAERRRDELLRLQSAEEAGSRYKTVVEQTGTAVIEKNFITGKVTVSPAYSKYEASRHSQEALFSNAGERSLVHPDDQGLLESFFEQSKERGRSCAEATLRLLMTDGSYRWTRMAGSFIYGEDGKLLRAIGTFTDADAQTRAQLALKALTERLDMIIKNIPTGIIICEPDERLRPVYASDRACEMFGFTREEYDLRIANRQSANFIPPKSALPEGYMQTLLSAKQLVIRKLRATRKDGSSFWLKAFCSMGLGSGAPLCYMVLADITGDVALEQSRAWQTEKNRILVEASGMISFDYSPLEDVMHMCVPTPEGLVEETRERYMDTFKSYGRIPPEQKDAFIAALKNACSKADCGEYEFEGDYFGAGLERYRAKYVSLSDDSGQVYRVVGRLEQP